MIVVLVDHARARTTANAIARYGQGRHAAGLNFGDGFAHAPARGLNPPPLFKDGGFVRNAVMRPPNPSPARRSPGRSPGP